MTDKPESPTTQQPNVTGSPSRVRESGTMNLATLRDHLLRLEETIIFALIERACFKANKRVYSRGEEGLWGPGRKDLAGKFSFLEYFLKQTESVHALMRRYMAEDENAFFPADLPAPLLALQPSTPFLKPNTLNFNDRVMSMYFELILPAICRPGDDGQYGSSASCDITALQAISKRVHYGKQVAEVKFREKEAEYTALIEAGNRDGIMDLLTNSEVEARLLERVRVKAATYGQEVGSSSSDHRYKIDPEVPRQIYKDLLIPLTKEIEVEYLLQRLDYQRDVAFLGPKGTFTHIVTQAKFSDCRHLSCDSLQEVFLSVLGNKSSYGVVPFFNSVSGYFQAAHERLFTTAAKVCGEVYLKIEHNLLSKCALKEIETIYSHPDALKECSLILKDKFPQVKLVPVSSTARGAELATKEPNSAAIGSFFLASIFDLSIVYANLENSKELNTRFLILNRESKSVPSGKDLTLLVIQLDHTDANADLTEALASFGQGGVKISSISQREGAGEDGCQYLLELKGHTQDSKMQKILKKLEQVVSSVSVLGSFQASPEPVNLSNDPS
eukprot:m.104347 g.104347  ORF g.104347 m.104347 type:complete len:558 (+) comp22443_c0_seq3:28-1701(+)